MSLLSTDHLAGQVAPLVPRQVTLSVVSHGQGALIRHLLKDIQSGWECDYELVVTLNIPEDEVFLAGFQTTMPLRVIRNARPKGFGANHNAAFVASRGRYFCVLNPDLRAPLLSVAPLVETLNRHMVGADAPAVYSSAGTLEDSARRFPSWWRLVKRVVLRVRGPDYELQNSPYRVDWVAGMFTLFRREAFLDVNGFDERYFMYFEDADICRRLAQRGWSVMLDPRVRVVHDAQRASHRDTKHLRWHLVSAFRYLTRL